jgi:hypothetical protein
VANQIIWLSFDLGIRGDYEGLYAWLDEHGAKECGDNLAAISFKHDGDSLPNLLRTELKKRVEIDNRSRIYVIYRHPSNGRNKGKFLFGSRRASPWTGYGPDRDAEDEEE